MPVAIGLLAPDKLGLHDMLGNVAEMVAEPYRLTRGGRSGGRAGGLVVDETANEAHVRLENFGVRSGHWCAGKRGGRELG